MLREIHINEPEKSAFRPYKLKYSQTMAYSPTEIVRTYYYGDTTICVSDEPGEHCGSDHLVSLSSPLSHPLCDEVIGSILLALGMDGSRVIDNYESTFKPYPGFAHTQYYRQPIVAEASEN